MEQVAAIDGCGLANLPRDDAGAERGLLVEGFVDRCHAAARPRRGGRRVAPAIDDRGNEGGVGLVAMQLHLVAGLALRQVLLGNVLEAEAHRQGDALAEGDGLAGAERGEELDQAGAGVGHRRADDRLVAVVGHAHGEDRRALRQDGGVEIGRALGDGAEEDAVFAAFLGDARQGLAGRAEAELAVGRGVAVRLLAADEEGARRRRSTRRTRRPCGRAPRRPNRPPRPGNRRAA